jgi:diacylglycerol kinase (ATP)
VTTRAACVAHVGSGEFARVADALAELRPRYGRIPIHPVQLPGEAGQAVAELAPDLDLLVVFGGDGTIHDAVGGLPLSPDDPAVALLPGGTGNDLVRGLGLPADAVAVARALVTGAPRSLDLLDCDGVRAANGVNAGFAAAATEPLSRRVKLLLGPAAYVVGGLVAGLRPPTWPARVEVDGEVFDGQALAVVAGNGPSFGGGNRLLEGADPADGLLDVLVVPATVVKGVAKGRLAARLMRKRLPDGLPRFRGPSATIHTEMPCRLDGEPQPTPASVKVLAGAWRVLLPA